MQLPISDKLLCYKIINYRNKLGGFINVEQVKETYGISDSVFNSIQKYLVIQNININKININTAPDFVLGAHPYIGRNVGKAIVIYREQHGNYATIDDVKKIVFITNAMFEKMAPYITVN
jgi:competence ComEA-like helix-hairpin-helix protein